MEKRKYHGSGATENTIHDSVARYRESAGWGYEYAPLLTKFPLYHGVTLCPGGHSKGAYQGFNLAFHVGDKEEAVLANRRLLATHLGVESETFTCAHQVHGQHIALIRERDKGCGALSGTSAIADTDALITKERGLPLLLFIADCVPVLLYDAVARQVAVVHAGWRGVLGRLPVATMLKMGGRPTNFYVYLGPAIGAASFEVSEDLAEQFSQSYGAHVVSYRQRNGREATTPHIDLKACILQDLVAEGMSRAQIVVSPTDSLTDETCFSYRRADGITGRMAMFAMLR